MFLLSLSLFVFNDEGVFVAVWNVFFTEFELVCLFNDEGVFVAVWSVFLLNLSLFIFLTTRVYLLQSGMFFLLSLSLFVFNDEGGFLCAAPGPLRDAGDNGGTALVKNPQNVCNNPSGRCL